MSTLKKISFALVGVFGGVVACTAPASTSQESAEATSGETAGAWGTALPSKMLSAASDPSPGCGSAVAQTGWTPQTIEIEGVQRDYRLYVPPGYTGNSPLRLVFVWHGLNGTADDMVAGLPLPTFSGADAVVIAAQGLPLVAGKAGWQTWPGSRDVRLFDALLARAKSTLCVDHQRVFSTGMSDGAIMTNFLGCVRGDALRAIAPMSGGLPIAEDLFCRQKVAAMVVHGTADTVVPVAVGRDSYRAWGDVNDCRSLPWASKPSDDAHCEQRANCPTEYPVLWCTHDGGHVIPNFAAASIWSFFSRF